MHLNESYHQRTKIGRTGLLSRSSFSFVEKIFHPNNGLTLFIAIIFLAYGVVPFYLSLSSSRDFFFALLAGIALVSVFSMWFGNRVPVFDQYFRVNSPRFEVSSQWFVGMIWVVFITFIIITFATAQSIPLISALAGADSTELSQQRGDFLKGRDGFWIVLLYVSAFLSTIVPYTILLLYIEQSKMRHIAAMVFVLYAVSFLVKALFLNIILPVLVYLAMRQYLRGRVVAFIIGGSLLLLLLLTILSLGGDEVAGGNGDFFSAGYSPPDPLIFLVWRALSVPIFTATDTLAVHAQQFDGKLLLGATSTFISSIFDLQRVNLERYVFEYQFGSWNEIANSNTVFIVDAFVNFGWGGVIVFGVFVGQMFRWFRLSHDVAFKSQWAIFAFLLFSSPLIGMMLSNGWIYMAIHALFIKVKLNDKSVYR